MEDKESMEICGNKAISYLWDFLDLIPEIGKAYALDVACGSGRLTEKLLVEHF